MNVIRFVICSFLVFGVLLGNSSAAFAGCDEFFPQGFEDAAREGVFQASGYQFTAVDKRKAFDSSIMDAAEKNDCSIKGRFVDVYKAGPVGDFQSICSWISRGSIPEGRFKEFDARDGWSYVAQIYSVE